MRRDSSIRCSNYLVCSDDLVCGEYTIKDSLYDFFYCNVGELIGEWDPIDFTENDVPSVKEVVDEGTEEENNLEEN